MKSKIWNRHWAFTEENQMSERRQSDPEEKFRIWMMRIKTLRKKCKTLRIDGKGEKIGEGKSEIKLSRRLGESEAIAVFL